MDGDSLDIPYMNPQDVDLSALRVMLIDGVGQWVYNATLDEWDWEGDIPQSRSKSGWHWEERSASIKAKLDEAGVAYDTYTLDEAGNLWSFNETTPFFDCASPDIGTLMGGGPWAKAQGKYEHCITSMDDAWCLLLALIPIPFLPFPLRL